MNRDSGELFVKEDGVGHGNVVGMVYLTYISSTVFEFQTPATLSLISSDKACQSETSITITMIQAHMTYPIIMEKVNPCRSMCSQTVIMAPRGIEISMEVTKLIVVAKWYLP